MSDTIVYIFFHVVECGLSMMETKSYYSSIPSNKSEGVLSQDVNWKLTVTLILKCITSKPHMRSSTSQI